MNSSRVDTMGESWWGSLEVFFFFVYGQKLQDETPRPSLVCENRIFGLQPAEHEVNQLCSTYTYDIVRDVLWDISDFASV